MRYLRKMFSCLTIIILIGIPFCSLSTAFATTIGIQPASSNQTLGSFFDVFVDITNVSDLYAFQFDTNFDPTVLQAVGSSESSFLPTGGGTFFIPGTIDNTSGAISFTADSLLGPDPGVTGNGHLVTLSFAAVGQGTSLISLSSVVLLDSSLSDIAFTSNDGSVNVSISSVPEPTTMLLFGTGIAGLAGNRLRRKKQSATIKKKTMNKQKAVS